MEDGECLLALQNVRISTTNKKEKLEGLAGKLQEDIVGYKEEYRAREAN